MLAKEITKDNLNDMVECFYTTILKDETVAPFFKKKFGTDMNSEAWKRHIRQLTNFWASLAFEGSEYRGDPSNPSSLLMGIEMKNVQQWLKLFYEVVDSKYEPKLAKVFKECSSMMVGNFMRNLGLVA